MEEKENRPAVAAAPAQESASPQRSIAAPAPASAGLQASLRASAPVGTSATLDLAKVLQLLRGQPLEIRTVLLDGSAPDYFYGHKYLILEVFQRCNHLEKQALMDALRRRD